MDRRLASNVVVGDVPAVLELLAAEGEALELRRDSIPFLDHSFHDVDRVEPPYRQGD